MPWPLWLNNVDGQIVVMDPTTWDVWWRWPITCNYCIDCWWNLLILLNNILCLMNMLRSLYVVIIEGNTIIVWRWLTSNAINSTLCCWLWSSNLAWPKRCKVSFLHYSLRQVFLTILELLLLLLSETQFPGQPTVLILPLIQFCSFHNIQQW